MPLAGCVFVFSTHRERERVKEREREREEWSQALYLHTEAFTESLGRQGNWWVCLCVFWWKVRIFRKK